MSLTTQERGAVERTYAGGLIAYVNRLREGHGVTFFRQKDGELGQGVCRCGEPCQVAPLLVHIDDLLRAYLGEVVYLQLETARITKENEKLKEEGIAGRDTAYRRRDAAEARVEHLERALRDGRALIEAMDLKMAGHEAVDDRGFIANYRLPTGPWHRLLAWARNG